MRIMKRTKGDIIFDSFNYIFVLILTFCFFYPFWHTLILSISTPTAANEIGLKIIPSSFSLGAYEEVLKSKYIYIGYFNTLFRTIIGTFLTVIVTFCAGYSLTKKQLPLRTFIIIIIFFTMFFNGGLIPRFILMKNLKLLGSRWALILPVLTSAWNIIITRNFISSLPDSLEEAALVDGAHPLQIAFKIMLPLSMPIIAVLALWTAVFHWNSWFDAMIYVRDREKIVLQLLLRRVLIEQTAKDIISAAALDSTQDRTTPETIKSTTIIVSILPIICVYPFLQKYFVKGLLIGSIKG